MIRFCNRFLFICIFSFGACANAQVPIPEPLDSLRQVLQDVTISVWGDRQSSLGIPSSVSKLSADRLRQAGSYSFVQAMNSVPGVRMEERSPGSLRLSIRGSLLRSPFGIRNVKIYWREMMLTDAGGNTYLNLVDPSQLMGMEINKGPAGSMFGAGTGGLVILQPGDPDLRNHRHGYIQTQAGSYGQFHLQGGWAITRNHFNSSLHLSHQQTKGYRDHSQYRKTGVVWHGDGGLGKKDSLQWLLSYNDLEYETPGGLTLAQAQDDPTQARPSTPIVPGPEIQQAGIYNRTLLAGITEIHHYSENWLHTLTAMTSHTGFNNPFLTNYERREETSVGLRVFWRYREMVKQGRWDLRMGMEYQATYSTIDNYGNQQGVRDTLQFSDQADTYQFFPFVHANWNVYPKIYLQAGISVNWNRMVYQRTSDPLSDRVERSFNNPILPRLALLFRPLNTLSFFIQVSRGYSTPTLAEVRPSDGLYYGALQPESGWNYEAGVKTWLWERRIFAESSIYYFHLEDAIVRRTNNAGAEYFVNAGGTRQQGWESTITYQSLKISSYGKPWWKIWTNLTWQNYFFEDYKSGLQDFSGNRVTGVPQRQWVSGLEGSIRNGVYGQILFQYTSKLPLNDANNEFAEDYRLLNARVGWEWRWKKLGGEIYLGVENIFNQFYSSGHDLNAFGRRYYNPSPERNWYSGLRFTF